MKQKGILFLAVLFSAALLSGCATTDNSPKSDITLPTTMGYNNKAALIHSMDNLTKAGKQAVKTQQMIAYANNAAKQSKVTYMGALNASVAQESVPIGWGKKVNIKNYTGGYKAVLKKIAKKANYTVSISPALLHIDPVVTINTQGNQTLIGVLHDIANELPSNYVVSANPVNQTLYVHLQNQGNN
jgi:hypothetical protein